MRNHITVSYLFHQELNNLIDRLILKTKKGDNGCIEWKGYCSETRYGTIRIMGFMLQAHRVSYELFIGPIESDLLACHRCDNRRCINPSHLFLGTVQDNTDDMMRKSRGRKAQGVDCGSAKLTEEQVRQIRDRCEAGANRAAMAREYGISTGALSKIALRKTWKHVE